MKRAVELLILDGFNDECGGISDKPVSDAVGFLSLWSVTSGRFPVVKVVGMTDGNLSALYFGADGKIGYEIFGRVTHDAATGAVSYSFHS